MCCGKAHKCFLRSPGDWGEDIRLSVMYLCTLGLYTTHPGPWNPWVAGHFQNSFIQRFHTISAPYWYGLFRHMCRHMKGFTNLSLHFLPLSALRPFVLSRNVVLSHPATQVERVLRQAAAGDGYRILVCIRKLDRKNEKQPLALCQGALFPNCESPNAMTAICCLSLSVECLHLSPTHVIQLDIRCAPSIDIAHAVHGPSATACMHEKMRKKTPCSSYLPACQTMSLEQRQDHTVPSLLNPCC